MKSLSRRQFMAATGAASEGFVAGCATAGPWRIATNGKENRLPAGRKARTISRELFVDDAAMDRMEGDAKLVTHRPESRDVVWTSDRPWENSPAYFAVHRAGATCRMYYRGFHHGAGEQALGEPMCYAESADGIHWTKPDLGLFLYEGSPENNIVLGGDLGRFPATQAWRGNLGTEIRWRADFVPFEDTRPGVEESARFKALIRGCRGFHQIEDRRWDYGLYPFSSPDGLHWNLLSDKPPITRGRFDSQNLAFWDVVHGRYVAFARDVSRGLGQPAPGQDAETLSQRALRDIRVSFSDDFLQWTDPVWVDFPGQARQQLYTNAVLPYERAPHILIGFPTLYFPEAGQTEPVFMSSRDGGVSFRLRPEPLVPRDAPRERDGNRSNYMAHGMIHGNDREYFVYATEGYADGERRLRRFVYRVDGFVSVRTGGPGGTWVTRPFIPGGDRLTLNYAAGTGGHVRVEVLDEHDRPIEGLTLADCAEMTGDEIERAVTWSGGSGMLSRIVRNGRPVRLHIAARNADVFALGFGTPPPSPVAR